MEIRTKSIIKAVFHGLIVLVGLIGVLVQAGVFEGKFSADVFSFFAVCTNIAVVIIYGLMLYRDVCMLKGRPERGIEVSSFFYGGMLTSILLVCFIYTFMFVPAHISGKVIGTPNLFSFSDILLHYIAPALVVADYILFRKKATMKWSYSLWWFIYPITYCIVAMARGLLGGEIEGLNSSYPYYFLDVAELGWGNVSLMLIAFATMFIGIGFIFSLLDTISSDAWKRMMKWSKRNGSIYNKQNEAQAQSIADNMDVNADKDISAKSESNKKGLATNANSAKLDEQANGIAENAEQGKEANVDSAFIQNKEVKTKQGTYINPYIKIKPKKNKSRDEAQEVDDRD